MRKWISIFENDHQSFGLFHATSPELAQQYLDHGWYPTADDIEFHLTNDTEYAIKVANLSGAPFVLLLVEVPISNLSVGFKGIYHGDVMKELDNSFNLPADIFASYPISSNNFKIIDTVDDRRNGGRFGRG